MRRASDEGGPVMRRASDEASEWAEQRTVQAVGSQVSVSSFHTRHMSLKEENPYSRVALLPSSARKNHSVPV